MERIRVRARFSKLNFDRKSVVEGKKSGLVGRHLNINDVDFDDDLP